VFLNLLVLEFKDLKAVGVSCLGCLSLSKVVNDALVWISLFHIFICEVDDQVPVRVSLPSYAVSKNHFLLARLIDALYLAIVSHNLIHHLLIFASFLVVLVKIL